VFGLQGAKCKVASLKIEYAEATIRMIMSSCIEMLEGAVVVQEA
jgi:hypothetical protein